MAIIDKIVVDRDEPKNTGVIWAKPEEKDIKVQLFNNGDWKVIGSSRYEKPSEGIPEKDLSPGVREKLNVATTAIQSSQKGVANGVATLDASGKLPSNQLPTVDTAPTSNSQNLVTSGGVYQALQNVEIDVDSTLSPTSENPIQNKAVKSALDQKANQATTYSKTEVDTKLSDVAHIGDDDGQAVIPDFDAETDSLWKKAQTLSVDEQDIVSANLFNKASGNGMGRVVLKKNQSFASQVTQANTIYVIKYDYNLNNASVTIPENCVLEFDGGSLSNGTLVGNDTYIKGRTDLSDILLSGSFLNKSFNLYDAGCIPNVDSVASNNSTKLLSFIRSLENTKVTLIVPDGDWYFDAPLVLSGDFSLQCKGRLVYKATSNNIVNTALTIGSAVKTFTQKQIIKLSQLANRDLFPATPPENVGVRFINADKCDISIPECSNFVYCVIFEGNDHSCCYNNVTLGILGYGNNYCSLKLLHVGNGWVNENLFLGGMRHVDSLSVYKNNNIGISIEGSSINSSNGNVFIKPCLEGSTVGVRFSYARNNVIKEMRDEAVSNTYETTNSRGNIVTTAFGGDLYNYIPVAKIEKADRVNTLRHTVFKERTGYVTYKIGSTTYASGIHLDVTTYNTTSVGNNIPLYGTNIYMGKIVDTSNAKAFSVALSAKGRCIIRCYDANDNVITPSSLEDVIENNTSVGVIGDGKTINGRGDQSFFMFVFSESVKKAFIGCNALKSEYIEVSAYTTNEYSELGTPISDGVFNAALPLTQENVKIGDTIFNNIGQKITWDGTKWVDSNGFPAASKKGTTATRPTLTSSDSGFQYYDTDLGKYICWNGTAWVNLDGTALS